MDIHTIDCAIENLLRTSKETDLTIVNDKLCKPMPLIPAFEVWASQLRYNIAEKYGDSVDSLFYNRWFGYRLICGENLYRVLQKEAEKYKLYDILPDYYYKTDSPKTISRYLYQRILGVSPDPVMVSTEDLWSKIKQLYHIQEPPYSPVLNKLFNSILKIHKEIRKG